jgi:hypothetical protein
VASIIYGLCALMSFGIAFLLWRGYAKTRSRVLFWSAWCFTGLTLNNVLLVLDKLVFPETDLSLFRQVTALVAVSLLLYGLVFEEE